MWKKSIHIRMENTEMLQNGECLCADLVTNCQDNISGRWFSGSNFSACAFPQQFQRQCPDMIYASDEAVFGPFSGCKLPCVSGQVPAVALAVLRRPCRTCFHRHAGERGSRGIVSVLKPVMLPSFGINHLPHRSFCAT